VRRSSVQAYFLPARAFPPAWLYAKGKTMDVNKLLQEIKSRPGFVDHVGMMMAHNGVVRAWSRKDHAQVSGMKLHSDRAKMQAICQEMEQREGIFAIAFDCADGELKPGDDALIFVVAGDIRENVKPVYAELLDRLKAEGCAKQEFFA
jgi:molybdopterin synthase catalytic subunit